MLTGIATVALAASVVRDRCRIDATLLAGGALRLVLKMTCRANLTCIVTGDVFELARRARLACVRSVGLEAGVAQTPRDVRGVLAGGGRVGVARDTDAVAGTARVRIFGTRATESRPRKVFDEAFCTLRTGPAVGAGVSGVTQTVGLVGACGDRVKAIIGTVQTNGGVVLWLVHAVFTCRACGMPWRRREAGDADAGRHVAAEVAYCFAVGSAVKFDALVVVPGFQSDIACVNDAFETRVADAVVDFAREHPRCAVAGTGMSDVILTVRLTAADLTGKKVVDVIMKSEHNPRE